MKDMLVTDSYIKYENSKEIGWKRYGFYKGKRFFVELDPRKTEISFDKENGEYYICNPQQEELLPPEIYKLLYTATLSNEYFLKGQREKEISIEVVMSLIEQGYNIQDIKMIKYSIYCEADRYSYKYLCKYLHKGNEHIIVKILDENTILWEV